MEALLDDPPLGVVGQHSAGVADDEQAGGPRALLLDGGADVLDRGADDALVGTAGALEDSDGQVGGVALCGQRGDERFESVQRHEEHDGAACDELGRVEGRALPPCARADQDLVGDTAMRGRDRCE